MLFFVELNKTNKVKFWLAIYSYFGVSMIMVIIIKKNKGFMSMTHVFSSIVTQKNMNLKKTFAS
jgi:hypothetical protein